MTCCLLLTGVYAGGLWLKRRMFNRGGFRAADPLAWRPHPLRSPVQA